jgi:hypothetical protein
VRQDGRPFPFADAGPSRAGGSGRQPGGGSSGGQGLFARLQVGGGCLLAHN